MTDPTATARGIAEVAKTIGGRKPILASWMGGQNVSEGRSILDAAGIPTYDYPDSASEMFSFMYKHSGKHCKLTLTFHLTLFLIPVVS
jgi:acetyltransferase